MGGPIPRKLGHVEELEKQECERLILEFFVVELGLSKETMDSRYKRTDRWMAFLKLMAQKNNCNARVADIKTPADSPYVYNFAEVVCKQKICPDEELILDDEAQFAA